MDFLGLRTLTVIKDTIDLVKANKGITVEFDQEMNDPKVYKLWQDGNTCGIFQFESQGMTNFMKEPKARLPRRFDSWSFTLSPRTNGSNPTLYKRKAASRDIMSTLTQA